VIAVTGGAGFIGAELVAGLERTGIGEIIAVDYPEPLARSRRLAESGCERTAGPAELLALLRSRSVEVVFHLGACTDTMTADWRYLFDNNVSYSAALLELCRQSGARLIYASSAAVYGHGAAGFREEAGCETPVNLYGVSKHLVDGLVRRRLAERTAQVVGLRYFNVYGAHEGHKGRMASMVFQLARQAERGGTLRLFAGSESFKRDFVHVDDVVDVNLFFYRHPDLSGIFNCGTGVAASFAEIAELLRRRFVAAEIEWIPFPSELRGRYQTHTCADLTLLRASGYSREFLPLAAGIARTVV
jgi:ADP-L-glycero-D-manno-heptose 6-epimerase